MQCIAISIIPVWIFFCNLPLQIGHSCCCLLQSAIVSAIMRPMTQRVNIQTGHDSIHLNTSEVQEKLLCTGSTPRVKQAFDGIAHVAQVKQPASQHQAQSLRQLACLGSERQLVSLTLKVVQARTGGAYKESPLTALYTLRK